MRPQNDRQGDWIADVPLSDPIFDALFQAPEEPPRSSENSDDQE